MCKIIKFVFGLICKNNKMKKFVKIFFVLSLVIFTTNSFAQDKNNPWQFSFGVSALNFNGTNESGEGLFDEYFGLEEHWNVQSSISTVSLSRYAGNGFSVGFRASLNNFTKLSDGFGKYPENRVSPMDMKSFDILVTKDLSKYSFYNFEPYVEIGAGQTHVENQQDNHVNLGVGVHYPISEKVSLKINTVYRKNFKNDGLVDYASKIHPHFQHSVGLSINFGGKDSDQDGVYDQHDDCPKIPGLPAFNGCPDSDGDGIEDSKDACPEVPGLLEFNGCADSDGDGVADPNDKCPSVAGLSKFDGCPDSDGDGIEDSKDECPNAAGPAGYGGCPDTDGDGVSDQNDKCPEIAGPADNNGCPNPTAEAIEKLNALGAVVQFELNKSNIKSEALDLLLAVYEIMATYGNTNFLIEGHTDTSGPKVFNNKLSLDRADEVKSHLVDKGVDANRLSTVGYGEDKPKESNKTRKGRIANRRVEFKVVE